MSDGTLGSGKEGWRINLRQNAVGGSYNSTYNAETDERSLVWNGRNIV